MCVCWEFHSSLYILFLSTDRAQEDIFLPGADDSETPLALQCHQRQASSRWGTHQVSTLLRGNPSEDANWPENVQVFPSAGWPENVQVFPSAGWPENVQVFLSAGWPETVQVFLSAGWLENVTRCFCLQASFFWKLQQYLYKRNCT